ncbi:glycine-rich cell wall structural protein 1-like [Panicum virgatum]|uniref:glycine-rich cell wall structural protein 1-like n=1 Tax=Panicum virgatum TaxID=38727 RepID=UPI0019D61D82|nr:glycine-rich cell wall structural protein 1-like [Panicum virgatum]
MGMHDRNRTLSATRCTSSCTSRIVSAALVWHARSAAAAAAAFSSQLGPFQGLLGGRDATGGEGPRRARRPAAERGHGGGGEGPRRVRVGGGVGRRRCRLAARGHGEAQAGGSADGVKGRGGTQGGGSAGPRRRRLGLAARGRGEAQVGGVEAAIEVRKRMSCGLQ